MKWMIANGNWMPQQHQQLFKFIKWKCFCGENFSLMFRATECDHQKQ